MKHFNRWAPALLSVAFALSLLSGCGQPAGDGEIGQGGAASPTDADLSLSASDTANPRTPAAIDLSSAAAITLHGDSAAVEGSGAQADGGVVTITAGGVYAVSGILKDGRIIVNAPGEDVTVALNGADITCSYGSPIYIYQAAHATVHLVEGTENALTDGDAYTFADSLSSAAEEEPNACLYSKDDLTLEGAGSLRVAANYNNGITSKDTLEVYDLTLRVTARNHGINGKDSNTIDSAGITVVCGGDAIRSTNDTDETLGWVSVSNSTLELDAGEDGIQAETHVAISSGAYHVTSGGGHTVEPGEDISAKGIQAGTELTLASGVYVLDCSDDALHAGGNMDVLGGSYTVSSYDDAFHSDAGLSISGGTVDVLASYEGLEGLNVHISGGEIHVTASDDGVNAAGGVDGSGFGGFGHGNAFGGGGSDYAITISGGYLDVSAGGDGLDSNGSLTISEGTVLVDSASSMDNVALDCQSSCIISGGTVAAASYGTMTERSPSGDTQCILSLAFDSTLPAGTYVEIKGEAQSIVLQMDIETNLLVFSSPGLVLGTDYTISYGGAYSGTVTDGVGQGGTYSGGTEWTTLTLSNYLTSYGRSGMGGGMPGGGNRPTGGGGMPSGGGGMPADGTSPEIPSGGIGAGDIPPSDGTAPDGGTAPGGMGQDGRGNRDGMPTDGTPPEIPAGGGTPPELPGSGEAMREPPDTDTPIPE